MSSFRPIFTMFGAVALIAQPVQAQLGIVTSVVGEAQLKDAQGNISPLEIGLGVEVGDRLITQADSYAMVFFVSGLGADIEFEGTIVAEIDQSTSVELRRGHGRRAPINVHVTRGRVRSFFDAGEHKDFILLSTPLGQMKVTGSVIYVAHDFGQQQGSIWGSFDSDCRVTLADGTVIDISQFQKVIAVEGKAPEKVGIGVDDVESFKPLEALNLASALAYRNQVRLSYAGRSWVGEYVTGGERLEDVASQGSTNIPSQEPDVASAGFTVTTRTIISSSRQTQPVLRASSGGRSAGDEEGVVGRQTSRRLRPVIRRR